MVKKILAVDDHVASLNLIQIILEVEGYEVQRATHVRQAIEMLYADFPDAIVMDLRLPEISGWECIQILKSRPETKHIPIVAVTASGILDYHKCQRTPYDAVVCKPFLPDELADHINRLVA